MSSEDGFLSRWSRRKALVREGREAPEAVPAPLVPAAPEPAPAAPVIAEAAPADIRESPPPPPPPSIDEAQALTPASDFTRFVARDVDPAVKNTALKKLFADPHFNVMDGLDTYIDDYHKPDPLPEGMLRQMVQAQVLGLFRDEERAAAAQAQAQAQAAPPPAPAEPGAPRETPDEDADLRLQPHDAAGRGAAGTPEPGAGEDPGREP